MQNPQYIPIDQAARAFGVSTKKLQYLAQTGNLPEASQVADGWLIPYEKLPAIATREEFVLDLNAATWPQATHTSDVEQYLSENVAAHAAVVLAKTQASAARSQAQKTERENQKLTRALRELGENNLDAETYIEELQLYIDQLEQYQRHLLEQLDQQANQLVIERAANAELTAKNRAFERELEDMSISMDWFSRLRYERRQLDLATHIAEQTIVITEDEPQAAV